MEEELRSKDGNINVVLFCRLCYRYVHVVAEIEKNSRGLNR